ncbi:MAG: sterol desaturase family protein [Bacteroidetes bacterium]|nr:MAG: sterol desaturase family protein [Bacteroidota bacterium]
MKLIVLSIPIFFLLIGVELLVQWLGKTRLYRLNDAVANISCGIAQQVSGVFFKTILFVGYLYLYENHRLVDDIAAGLGPALTYSLLFIGVDFFYYWFHRYSHEISFIWGAHVVHHQSEEYNLSVALRQSAFQSFFSTIFYLPLAWIGFHPAAFVTINALQTLYQFWIHTRAIGKLPAPIEYVFNTPSHHRVHHGRNPKYIDKNHGGTLIIFDRMFGTFQAEEEEVVYGVTKPLNTWNPLWANFDYYADLWQAVRETPGLGNKLRTLVNKPGWRPAAEGGPIPIPEVQPEAVRKYDPPITAGLSYYVLVQFVLVLSGTSLYLFADPGVDLRSGLAASLILAALGSLGGLLDGRAWGTWLEGLRHLALPVLSLYLFPAWPVAWTLAGIGSLSLASLAWLWHVRPLGNAG